MRRNHAIRQGCYGAQAGRAVVLDVAPRMGPLGVELNQEKTKVVDLLKGATFGFLGFDLRRVRKRKGTGHYLQMTPKKKARKAIKAKVRDIIWHSGSHPDAEGGQADQCLAYRLGPILPSWQLESCLQ